MFIVIKAAMARLKIPNSFKTIEKCSMIYVLIKAKLKEEYKYTL